MNASFKKMLEGALREITDRRNAEQDMTLRSQMNTVILMLERAKRSYMVIENYERLKAERLLIYDAQRGDFKVAINPDIMKLAVRMEAITEDERKDIDDGIRKSGNGGFIIEDYDAVFNGGGQQGNVLDIIRRAAKRNGGTRNA